MLPAPIQIVPKSKGLNARWNLYKYMGKHFWINSLEFPVGLETQAVEQAIRLNVGR